MRHTSYTKLDLSVCAHKQRNFICNTLENIHNTKHQEGRDQKPKAWSHDFKHLNFVPISGHAIGMIEIPLKGRWEGESKMEEGY